MLAMAAMRPTTRRRIPKTFIACLRDAVVQDIFPGPWTLLHIRFVVSISNLLQFLQSSSTRSPRLARDFRSKCLAVRGSTVALQLHGEDYPMRHSETSPAIHNV